MSTEKIALIGLKNQERAEGGEKAPIRYVPDRDPVQEALDLKPETLVHPRKWVRNPSHGLVRTRYQRAVCTAREQGV
eukprot:CCRYP_014270-RA/>CCRYP_014270-RA protein AED:0.20 eAED:0.20 QI:0/-1/0/1/-1/1/1/0/76